MKTSLLRLGAVFGISIGALALPNTALAGGGGGLCNPGSGSQVLSCHFSGLIAEAAYQSGSLATTETDVSIFAMEGKSLQAGGGGPVSEADASIFISKLASDPTSPKGIKVIAELWGDLPGATGLTIDKSLSSADLSGVVIPVYGFDENGAVNGRLITIGANWTGTGSVSRANSRYSFRSGAFSYMERYSSSYRPAMASASAVDGSTDWISGATETYADLQSTSDMTLTITRP